MKAIITGVELIKDYESKFGTLYLYKISYDGKQAFYSSKSDKQEKFIKGQEAEFIEEVKTGKNGNYFNIKPVPMQRQSNFSKELKKEKSKYSGFAVSYAKDLVVAGKLEFEELTTYAWILFDLMAEMDKTLEQ